MDESEVQLPYCVDGQVIETFEDGFEVLRLCTDRGGKGKGRGWGYSWGVGEANLNTFRKCCQSTQFVV